MTQSLGSIMQVAYVVEDLESAAQRWVRLLGAGPFFLLEHIAIIEPTYRGHPTTLNCSIALGYSGGVCIELIQQHNDVPSVFRERPLTAGGVFHHWAVMTESFDADVERYTGAGYAIAFCGAVAVGGRFSYVDTAAELGGMLELIEVTPPVQALFAGIEAASLGWNGEDPVRRL